VRQACPGLALRALAQPVQRVVHRYLSYIDVRCGSVTSLRNSHDSDLVRNMLTSQTMNTMTRRLLAIASLLMALSTVPEGVVAQYHGVTNHRASRRASRMQRPGWSQAHAQQQQQGVPEFDPNAAGAAFALLVGGLAVLVSSRSRLSATQA